MHDLLALTLCCVVLCRAVLWCAVVCCAQVNPSPAMIPGLQVSGLDLETVVSPSQAQLPGLYKGHDVFLFTSRYMWLCLVFFVLLDCLPQTHRVMSECE